MFSSSRIYGLDIETDTRNGQGLNPAESRVTEVSLDTEDGGVVFAHDDEEELLTELGFHVLQLPPGLLVTWNGAAFDMPFLADRYKAHRMTIGPNLSPDPKLVTKYPPLVGHDGAYQAAWGVLGRGLIPHQHLDISYAYRDFAAAHGIDWKLKPVCKAAGIDMVELDRTRLHEYTPEQREAYVLSDSRGARLLGLRTLGLNAAA